MTTDELRAKRTNVKAMDGVDERIVKLEEGYRGLLTAAQDACAMLRAERDALKARVAELEEKDEDDG